MIITRPQIEGLIRAVMLLLSGFALSFGIDEGTWATVTGGIIGIAGAFWSIKSNSVPGLATQLADSSEVKQVVLKSAKMSDAIPSAKVISNEP
jgi:Na+/glutamate symporter